MMNNGKSRAIGMGENNGCGQWRLTIENQEAAGRVNKKESGKEAVVVTKGREHRRLHLKKGGWGVEEKGNWGRHQGRVEVVSCERKLSQA